MSYFCKKHNTVSDDYCPKCMLEKCSMRGLALATLCDMVLGEDAEDRSDDALIRAVGELLRDVELLGDVEAFKND